MLRKNKLDAQAIGLGIVLCSILGLQQIAIKEASIDITPLFHMALRSGISALCIGIYLTISNIALIPTDKSARSACLLAGFLFTLEYFFMAEGLRFTNASRIVVMVYTAPAFAPLGLHIFVPSERLHARQWGGLLLAFAGIVIAFFDNNISSEKISSILYGDILGLFSGISWGATTVLIRMKLSDTPAIQTTFSQLIIWFFILFPLYLLSGKYSFDFSTTVIFSLLFQIIMVCILAICLWFWMLTVYPASQLGVLLFLTPIFGVLFGMILLDEQLTTQFIAGTICIILGIIFVQYKL